MPWRSATASTSARSAWRTAAVTSNACRWTCSGIGIALTVRADKQAIYFQSDHYFLQVGQRKLRLPSWLRPGTLTIAHKDLGGGRFLFSLILRSRLFGELIRQDAIFNDR